MDDPIRNDFQSLGHNNSFDSKSRKYVLLSFSIHSNYLNQLIFGVLVTGPSTWVENSTSFSRNAFNQAPRMLHTWAGRQNTKLQRYRSKLRGIYKCSSLVTERIGMHWALTIPNTARQSWIYPPNFHQSCCIYPLPFLPWRNPETSAVWQVSIWVQVSLGTFQIFGHTELVSVETPI